MEGALFFNGFYPGHIAVPENTAFEVLVGETKAVLYIARHLRPVVVTDFGNELVESRTAGSLHLRLRRPILEEPNDSISADAKGLDGNPETLFAATKDYDYCLYRRQSFTDITVGAEVARLDHPGPVNPAIWEAACTSVIALYRLQSLDVSVPRLAALRRNYPIIRQQRVRYSASMQADDGKERLLRLLPSLQRSGFSPVIFSYREFSVDIPRVTTLDSEQLERIGHHAAVGTAIPEEQEALVNAFEALAENESPRFALVDAFSVAERVAFRLLNSLRSVDPRLDRRLARREAHGNLGMKIVINSFLPGLLKAQTARWPNLIGGLDQARKWRDAALHQNEIVTPDQAARALNGVQSLLFAVDERLGGGLYTPVA
jgi:hypothetical protein